MAQWNPRSTGRQIEATTIFTAKVGPGIVPIVAAVHSGNVLPAVRQLGKLASNPLVQRLIGVLNAYHKKYGAQESEAFGYYACIVLQNGAAGTDTWKIDPEPYGTPNSGPASVDGNGGGARPAPRGAKDSKAAQAGSRKAPSSPKPKKGRNR